MLIAAKPKVDPAHVQRIKEKELENAEQQLSFYEGEIDRLQKKIEDLSGVDKIFDLEQKVQENKDRIRELNKIYHDLLKVQKDNGDLLMRLENGNGQETKVKAVLVEMKVWRDKIHRVER